MAIIKKSLSHSVKRQVDSYLGINDLFSEPTASFDLVVGSLNGPHGKYINKKSDKAYLILEGNGMVHVGNEMVEVGPMDFVYIPKGTPHGIKGEIKFLIITSPPFDPQNESSGDELR